MLRNLLPLQEAFACDNVLASACHVGGFCHAIRNARAAISNRWWPATEGLVYPFCTRAMAYFGKIVHAMLRAAQRLRGSGNVFLCVCKGYGPHFVSRWQSFAQRACPAENTNFTVFVQDCTRIALNLEHLEQHLSLLANIES